MLDVTWRYSAKHEEVRKARTLVSEEWLEKTLAGMTEEVNATISIFIGYKHAAKYCWHSFRYVIPTDNIFFIHAEVTSFCRQQFYTREKLAQTQTLTRVILAIVLNVVQ